jgi:hypothetical protein
MPPVAISEAWTYCITPTTPKDWSCIATILKALSADRLLVAWSDDVEMGAAAIRFLNALPATKLLMGYESSPPPFLPDAILFSGQRSKDALSIRKICETLPARNDHGPCALPSLDAWTELLSTLEQSEMSLMITDVDDKAWTPYWYKLADSQSLTAEDVKDRVSWLLSAAQQLLALSP